MALDMWRRYGMACIIKCKDDVNLQMFNADNLQITKNIRQMWFKLFSEWVTFCDMMNNHAHDSGNISQSSLQFVSRFSFITLFA